MLIITAEATGPSFKSLLNKEVYSQFPTMEGRKEYIYNQCSEWATRFLRDHPLGRYYKAFSISVDEKSNTIFKTDEYLRGRTTRHTTAEKEEDERMREQNHPTVMLKLTRNNIEFLPPKKTENTI